MRRSGSSEIQFHQRVGQCVGAWARRDRRLASAFQIKFFVIDFLTFETETQMRAAHTSVLRETYAAVWRKWAGLDPAERRIKYRKRAKMW
jgi:hypothetical protein